MAEGLAGDQLGGSVDTDQGVVIQQEQPSTLLRVSRGISSPGSSGEAASLSLAATAAPSSSPGRKSQATTVRMEGTSWSSPVNRDKEYNKKSRKDSNQVRSTWLSDDYSLIQFMM